MREALLKLLNGELPDEIIWSADITYWMAGQEQAGTANPDWKTEEGFLRLHRDLGIMPYYYYEKFWVFEPQYDSMIEILIQTEGNRTLRRFRTPLGELMEENVMLTDSSCQACTRHLVESEKDLNVLMYLLEHRRLVPTNLDDYPERLKIWAKYDGIPSIGLPRSPLSSFCYEWTGIENMVYLLKDYEDKVRKILNMMEEQETPVLEMVCQAALPLIHFPDNMSSANLAGLYDEFMADAHRKRLSRLHSAGVKCAVHLDGSIKGLFHKLVKVGFDSIEALTPKPVGDMDVNEIRNLAGNDSVILWGGIPGAMFCQPYTWDDMKRHVEKLLISWQGMPFILGVGDQVPPDGNIDFCRKISELIRH